MTKRKGRVKRKSRINARQRASERLKSQEPKPVQPTTGANGGAGVPMPIETKSEQRFAARLLSLGIVSEEETKAILKKAFVFAARAEKVRDYSTAMRVITTAAKLEVDATIKNLTNQHPGNSPYDNGTGTDRPDNQSSASRLSDVLAQIERQREAGD